MYIRFFDLETMPFSASDYSRLKFGSNAVAKKFGYELAEAFFAKHCDAIMANKCVIIPSPYNHVENAATIMTKHFIDHINHLLVEANGEHVEFDIIHRKVSYVNDYGFLSKEKRKGLIDNDMFYLNKDFLKDKMLIFIDDVKITGTHEEKIKEVLADEKMDNNVFYIYYARYFGNTPDIEAAINFAAIKSPGDYVNLILNDGQYHVIVRTIKYLLSLTTEVAENVVSQLPSRFLSKIYNGALGEGYYKIPSYQKNFEIIKNKIKGK